MQSHFRLLVVFALLAGPIAGCAYRPLAERTVAAAPLAAQATKGAMGGDLRQQHLLAYGFAEGGRVRGIEFPKRPDLAIDWLKRAAEQNDPDALYGLALAYYAGKAVPRSVTTGFYWMRRAAEQAHVRAQVSVSISYRVGEGVAKDSAHAERWFRAALLGSHRFWRRVQARRLFILHKPPLPDSARLWDLAGFAICTRQLPFDVGTNARLLYAAARAGDPVARRDIKDGAYFLGRERGVHFCSRWLSRTLS